MLKGILRRRADAPATTRAPEPTTDRRGAKRSPVTLPSYRLGTEPLNKGRRYPAEPLTVAEVYALLRANERIGRRARQRNRALIYLFWRSGLRCAEALALMPKDVDVEHGRVAVLHGKGDKRRICPLDPQACREVGAWMAERLQLGLGAGEPVFCVIQGRTRGLNLGDAYVRDLLKRLAAEAGITKRVHPHGLRHTWAAYLVEQGVPVTHLRRLLGHSTLAMTQHYADHLLPFEALERANAIPWPEAA